MPDAYTPTLGLVLPEIGASRDTWGAKLNSNFSELDGLVSRATPIGAIIDFAGPNAPPGWLVCDGRWVSRTQYSALFAVIGGWWGAGDGSTSFALPNFNGRTGIGPGGGSDANGTGYSYAFSQRIGAITNNIAQGHLPNYNLGTDAQGHHTHGMGEAGWHGHTTDAQGSHNHDTGGAGGGAAWNGDHNHSAWTDAQGAHAHTVTMPNLGTGAANGPYGVLSNLFGDGNRGTSVDGSHGHNVGIGVAGGHVHALYWDGNHAHNVYGAGTHSHEIWGAGSHGHNVYLGGSWVPFPILSPVLVITKIIFAGKQAAPAAQTAATAMSLMDDLAETEDLAIIRRELAELRALLAPPGRPQRLLSSPSRGPH